MSLPWSQFPTEELRLAGVFNGGVSLAVWMGGATHELNRLVHSTGEDDPYHDVLEFVCSTAIVDVVTGTSAGGINGAALAMAQANPNADLAVLRDIWLEQGRFDTLLRQPFQGNPTSLLRGDEYFLPALSEAMVGLARSPGVKPLAAPDMDLRITTSLLEPSDLVVPDGLGQLTHQQVHAGQFAFDASDFPEAQLPTTARKLGLAARASASFPLAFEPTFIPVDGPTTREDLVLRPDMADHASWRPDSSTQDLSRYVADGGLLANTPLPYALKAIRQRPAHVPVRRSLLLIYPHAQLEATVVHVRQEDPPTVTGGLLGMVSAVRSHSGQTFLEELEEHNRNVDAWRGGREDALALASGTLADLYGLVKAAWGPYRSMRMRLSAATLAQRVRHDTWSYDRIRQAAYDAQLADPAPSPYVPALPPPALESVGLDASVTVAAGANPLPEWRWGPVVAMGVCDALETMLRTAGSIASQDQVGAIRSARTVVIDARAEIRRQRDALDSIWAGSTSLLEPDQGYWSARLAAYRLVMVPPPAGGSEGEQVSASTAQVEADWATVRAHTPGAVAELEQLRDTRPGAAISGAVWDAVRGLGSSGATAVLGEMWGTHPAQVSGLETWRPLLTGPALTGTWAEPEDDTLRLLLRLLALDTATRMITNGDTTPGTQIPIQAAQLSLAVEHDFAKLSRRPSDKAAGLNLGHFAGFLKRAWRSNDWTWGRLDAAQLLCEVVLNPERLRLLSTMVDAGTDVDGRVEDVLAHLTATLGPIDAVATGKIRAELSTVFDVGKSLPSRLPHLAGQFALSIERELILEELPHLQKAIVADRLEKQSTHSRGELFLALHEKPGGLYDRLASGTGSRVELGDEALKAFDEAGIGRDVLREEAGSDAMIQTAANTAGVVATVFGSDRFGIKAIAPAAKSMRGAIMLPYWILRGLTSGGTIAQLLARLAVVVGGVLLTLGLLGQLGGFSSYASAAGVATLLAVLGYSAMRTGTLLHGVVLIAATGPLIAYAWSGRGDADDPSGIAGALAVAGVCLALWILASLPWPLLSPRALAKQLRIRLVEALRPHRRLLLSLLAGFVVVCLLTAGLVWLLVTQLSEQLEDAVDAVTTWVPDNAGWLPPVAAVVSCWWGLERSGQRRRPTTADRDQKAATAAPCGGRRHVGGGLRRAVLDRGARPAVVAPDAP